MGVKAKDKADNKGSGKKKPEGRVNSSRGNAVVDKAVTALLDELREVASVLPEEDIDFLVRQAKVFREERAVEEATLALEARYREVEAGQPAGSGETGGRGKGKNAKTGNVAEDRRMEPVHIVRSASGSANLVLKGEFKLLTDEELDRVVKIALASGSEAERALALWRWLDRERRDILIDGDMVDERSPLLVEMLRYLEKTFSAMKEKRKGIT